jgi:hypothetical protein
MHQVRHRNLLAYAAAMQADGGQFLQTLETAFNGHCDTKNAPWTATASSDLASDRENVRTSLRSVIKNGITSATSKGPVTAVWEAMRGANTLLGHKTSYELAGCRKCGTSTVVHSEPFFSAYGVADGKTVHNLQDWIDTCFDKDYEQQDIMCPTCLPVARQIWPTMKQGEVPTSERLNQWLRTHNFVRMKKLQSRSLGISLAFDFGSGDHGRGGKGSFAKWTLPARILLKADQGNVAYKLVATFHMNARKDHFRALSMAKGEDKEGNASTGVYSIDCLNHNGKALRIGDAASVGQILGNQQCLVAALYEKVEA